MRLFLTYARLWFRIWFPSIVRAVQHRAWSAVASGLRTLARWLRSEVKLWWCAMFLPGGSEVQRAHYLKQISTGCRRETTEEAERKDRIRNPEKYRGIDS